MSDSDYQIVTDTIIQKLRADAILRHTPWKSFEPSRILVPGKSRRGIIACLLAAFDHSRPHCLACNQSPKAADFILGKATETNEVE